MRQNAPSGPGNANFYADEMRVMGQFHGAALAKITSIHLDIDGQSGE
jgi:hypothetical protein